MRKFICLGFNVDKEKGYVTGLAMMHDLFIAIIKERGLPVKSISLNPRFSKDGDVGKPSLSRYIEYFSIIWAVLKEFIRNKNAIFYFNPSTNKAGFHRDVLMVGCAKLFGHKVLMQQFGALFESFKNSLNIFERKILTWSYNKADIIIVEGEYAKKQYEFIKDQCKIKTIQNGLPELSKNIHKESKFYESSHTFRLFFMNNMIESKGYVDVLKAVNILVNERHCNVKCTFAGRFMTLENDEYFKNKEEAISWFKEYNSIHNLSDRVKYFESVFDEKKASLFEESHVFLLPSYYIFEGQPTAILEALSYGCVPIVTRYRLISDMIDESCGIFVNCKSPIEIADAVESLINEPEKYRTLSVNGFNRFNERFTQQAYAKKILKVVSEL